LITFFSLGTYSNLENHPTLIREKSQKINLNRKTGLPIVESLVENKNEENIKFKCDKQNVKDNEHNKGIEIEEDEKDQTRGVNLGEARSKHESKEGKKLRKQNIKAERKNRRVEKKSLKQAFAKERTKQTKISYNISRNLAGGIHLD